MSTAPAPRLLAALVALIPLAACGPVEVGALTVVLKRGDVDPFVVPGTGAEPTRAVTALRFSWDVAPLQWPADAGVITVALGGGATQRLAVPAPATPGQLTVEGVISATGEAWSLGRSLRVAPPRGDAAPRVTVVLGPRDGLTAVAAPVSTSPAFAGAARLGDTGALLVGGEAARGDGGVDVVGGVLRYDRETLEVSTLDPAPRAGAVAVTLPSGRALFGLGRGADGALLGDLWLAEPDGTLRALSTSGATLTARTDASALTLRDGTVLLVGGRDASGPLREVARLTLSEAAAQVTVDALPPLELPLSAVALAQLATGEVLAAGGLGANDVPSPKAWWLDLAATTPAWRAPDNELSQPRVRPQVVRLEDDSVLLWGGGDDSGDVFSLVAASNGGFARLAVNLSGLHDGATVLRLGRSVLFVGGERGGEPPFLARFVPLVQTPSTSQQYGGTWRPLASSASPRQRAAAVELADGAVLLYGGGPERLELFTPSGELLDGSWAEEQ
jgi:hypothetical protein